MTSPTLVRAMKLSPWLSDLRRDFHRHPELAFTETRTSERVAEELGKMGIDCERGVGGTGVVARIGGDGPAVALRGDMDALPITEVPGREYGSTVPGIMHACGHDAHTAILLGTASLLSSMELPGSVVLMFQPGEEVAKGASAMMESGFLGRHDVRAVLGLHVHIPLSVGQIGVNMDRCCASVDNFRAVIKGKKAHGAYPHLGKDAIVMAGQALVQLQSIVSREVDPLDGAVVTVGSISGGSAPNIIADQVVMEGTLRSHRAEDRRLLSRRLGEILSSVASCCGGDVELSFDNGCPALVNDRSMAEMVIASGRELLGDGVVVLDHPTMGGEDFAFFMERFPGAFFRLGAGCQEKGIVHSAHTAEFDLDEGCLPIGVAMMTDLSLRWHRKLKNVQR